MLPCLGTMNDLAFDTKHHVKAASVAESAAKFCNGSDHHAAAQPVSAWQSDTMSVHLQGLPICSAQWGAWGAAGMASDKPWLIARLARLGLGLLRPQEGLHALTLMVQQAVTPAGALA